MGFDLSGRMPKEGDWLVVYHKDGRSEGEYQGGLPVKVTIYTPDMLGTDESIEFDKIYRIDNQEME